MAIFKPLQDGEVTAAKLATEAKPIGVGQTWQTVTRSNGVTYTNTTGRPITVSIAAWSSNGGGSVSINGEFLYFGLGRSTYFNTMPFLFVVPINGTYSFSNLDYVGIVRELK